MGIFKIVKRIADSLFGGGKARKKLAIENIFYVLLAGGFVFLLVYLFNHRYDGTVSCESFAKWGATWLGIFVCAVAAAWSFCFGVLSQAVLLVCSLLGCLLPKERGANFAAFAIALLSLAAITGGGIFFYFKFF